jgi:competence protein ComEC
LAAAISIGILAGSLIASHPRTALICGAISVAAIAALSIWLVRKRKPAATTLLLVAGFVLTGLALSLIYGREVSPGRISRMYEEGLFTASDPVELTGTIDGQPEPAPQSLYLSIRAERIKLKGAERDATGRILLPAQVRDQQLAQEYEALQLRHGARIRVLVNLDRKNNFRNPGVMPFTEYLEREGYDATGVIRSPLLIERLDDARVFLPLALLYEWRESLQRRIHTLFSPETAGILDAALLGNHRNISLGAAERFRAGGTFHVLVISGMQIAFIGGLMLLVVRWFTKRRILQVIMAATFLWGYTIAVGADTSVGRSAFMFTTVLLAPLVSRRGNTLNSLGGAAIALLVWRPEDLFDPSFQLTFLSVLSIVTIAVPLISRMRQVGSWRPTHETPYPPAVSNWFRAFSEALFWSERQWKAEMAGSNIRYRLFKTTWASSFERWRLQKLLRYSTNAIVISASVQIGMLPLMIIYFHRVSLAALLLNIFVGGLMALLVLVAFAATLVAILSGKWAAPLKMITEKIDWLMIHSVDPFSWLGIDSIRLPHFRGCWAGVYVLYFFVLSLLVFALARWKPLRLGGPLTRKTILARRSVDVATAGFLLIALIIVTHPFSGDRPDGKLHVDFLDEKDKYPEDEQHRETEIFAAPATPGTWMPFTSLYMTCISLVSRRASCTSSVELKRVSKVLPVLRFRMRTWTNARRFPGVRCWNSMTRQGLPSWMMTVPRRISLAFMKRQPPCDGKSDRKWPERSSPNRP